GMVSANIVVAMNLILNNLFYFPVITIAKSLKNFNKFRLPACQGRNLADHFFLEVSIEYLL
ncbi:MAG: hypothetical protein M3278_06015, partial [Thermoproteota archaeon]|nr:hypothetical protein [Thermoproteota archaeon]